MKLVTIPEFLKPTLDKILDYAEDKAQASERKWDDAVVFTATGIIRAALDIPDDD